MDKLNPFVMGAFGKQRRTLELDVDNDNDAGDDLEFIDSYCDALLGLKGGVEFLLTPNVVLAPAVGVAFNLEESDRTSFFADLELNRVFNNGGYFGTGVGLWDFNHGDNVTFNLLLHGGFPLTRYPEDGRHRLLFVVEGRIFFDELDEIDNNYQFWGGLR